MGLKQDALDFIFRCIDMKFDSYQGLTMLELGNQMVKKDGKRTPAKKYFSALGFEHTSFDINGKDGAIAIDLSKPIPSKFSGMFDIITNAGTSEHVAPLTGQYECFKNIHECAKTGGIMIHIVPQDGSFTNHSPFYYTQAFFERLASANEYTIFQMAALARGDNAFVAAGLLKCYDRPFTDNKDTLLAGVVERPCSRSVATRRRKGRIDEMAKKLISLCRCGKS